VECFGKRGWVRNPTNYQIMGCGWCKLRWYMGLGNCRSRPLPPGVYAAEVKFGIEKLGVVCIYPCPNMLIIVCCGIPKVGVNPRWWFDCGSGSPVGLRVGHESVVCRCTTCVWITLSKTNSVNRRRRINTSSIKFFSVSLFYQPT
jgi:hypothetical protein